MNIGENIKKIRIEKGLTRTDLAKFLKVSDSTISRYENNKREPSIDTLGLIADFLGVDILDLLGFSVLRKNIDNIGDKVDNIGDKYHDMVFKDLDDNNIKEFFSNIVLDILMLSNLNPNISYNSKDFSSAEVEEIISFIFNAYQLKVNEILERHNKENS
ncbi:helix-turn-helix domain-containing protein [Clostridium tertium]|uniref:Helix-turn-helix domain-containing protein n=1 Tax=Clostridium tertium TaxID=1559 RepID=A0A9X4B206_9CLOT|nr:helix-turn-helix transcriptional regulator [Clostridium tertium]MDC4241282.1 helix-turn-helix domain-containing protein [Clostridium tertium]